MLDRVKCLHVLVAHSLAAGDVQTALTVLGARDSANDGIATIIDLENTDLAGADLSFATLTDATLKGTNLDGAILDSADLQGTSWWPGGMPDHPGGRVCQLPTGG